LQWGCIVGQWLLAVLWWWQGPTLRQDSATYYHEQQQYKQSEGEYSGAGLVWELLVVMLIELMLSLLFTALKLAKADRTHHAHWAQQQRNARRASLHRTH
jgi:hypothetical protein